MSCISATDEDFYSSLANFAGNSIDDSEENEVCYFYKKLFVQS